MGHEQQCAPVLVKNRAMPIPPKQQFTKITLRLPAELLERIERESVRNGRSNNAEILARLFEAYAQPTMADLLHKQEESIRLVRQALEEIEAFNLRR